ncbi:nuclear transport factor 2 family protein [Labilibaculum sp. DW002]|uniref:Nuclear transport factor 2 family protein n=1 Tax=Paralabilibaculum antarcticum TaxID=2912572 RepID=A0ABT5VR40_9BACT|nr:nuclear transport factor 2 family protein [Labilibaculum sp. DW002]MDE5417888.1 nuclear transport factor 2 family protein [Labilibaculum sp. DW002]
MPNQFRLLGFLFILMISSCNTIEPPKEKEVAEFITNWHKAAADANINSYFGMMSEDAIYIGTDASERWTKKEFFQFCEPHFAKGKAWDFKAFDRKIYFSEDGKTAWFNELLNTWMGVCRASGVIRNENNTLLITHYHLSVTIKNEKVKEFLQINQN